MSSCPRCGADVKDRYNYCGQCGVDLSAHTPREQLIQAIERDPEGAADAIIELLQENFEATDSDSERTPGKDPLELSNEELLEQVAELDPEKFPIANHARRALGWDQENANE